MLERFSPGARTVVLHAQSHARRLGHRYVGSEHLLLALAGSIEPAGDVLRAGGLTTGGVEAQIVGLVGLGAGAGLFADLDREALDSIGVDLDAVRARIEAAFGPAALHRASQAAHQARRPSRLNPRRAVPPAVLRLRHRRRRARLAATAPRVTDPAGRYRAPGPPPTGHLPFAPRAKQALQRAVDEARAGSHSGIGAEYIALGVLHADGGLVPTILSALGVSAPVLREAVLDRYRQAS